MQLFINVFFAILPHGYTIDLYFRNTRCRNARFRKNAQTFEAKS